MDKAKKILLFRIPMSICNFRCSYCYIGQREECYQGIQPEMKYTPEQVAYACRRERIGGIAYMNFCADGETLLTKNLDQYIHALVKEGHYAEIVTNMTVTPMIKKILSWEPELLKRVEFKCSFHYLQLKKKNLLDKYADNIKAAWAAGASANIEITPSDDLIPYLEEVKEFSIKNFGALHLLSIARDDRTSGIDYLTNLSMEEYDSVWSQFNSDFWAFKKTIFGVKRNEFCYAGKWSAYIDLTTGLATPCYCGACIGNVFENPDSAFLENPIGKCKMAHCYNGHVLMTMGLIPSVTNVRYGDIRNRKTSDENEWLQPELLAFFNSKLSDTNAELSNEEKKKIIRNHELDYVLHITGRVIRRMKRIVKNK